MLTSRPVKPERRADKRGRNLSVLKSEALKGRSVLTYPLGWVRLNQFPELSFTIASMP
jgi:hypothetical protein